MDETIITNNTIIHNHTSWDKSSQQLRDIKNILDSNTTSINHIIHLVSEIATKLGFEISLPSLIPLSPTPPIPLTVVAAGSTPPTPLTTPYAAAIGSAPQAPFAGTKGLQASFAGARAHNVFDEIHNRNWPADEATLNSSTKASADLDSPKRSDLESRFSSMGTKNIYIEKIVYDDGAQKLFDEMAHKSLQLLLVPLSDESKILEDLVVSDNILEPEPEFIHDLVYLKSTFEWINGWDSVELFVDMTRRKMLQEISYGTVSISLFNPEVSYQWNGTADRLQFENKIVIFDPGGILTY